MINANQREGRYRSLSPAVWVAALAGALSMAAMMVLMFLMTTHMGQMTERVTTMTDDVHRMQEHVSALSTAVGRMAADVGYMEGMARDIRGMRDSIEQMTGVMSTGFRPLQGMAPEGVDTDRMSPLPMMRQMLEQGTSR
jgi:hypothetical protein